MMSGADEGRQQQRTTGGGCTKKKRPRVWTNSASTVVPHLPLEIVTTEILARLPVKSLLRFRSVCKAWRTVISGDLSLVSAHLQHQPQPSSLLIFPLLMCDRPDDDHHRYAAEKKEKKSCSSMAFYRWEPQPPLAATISLVHAVDDMPPEAHCRRVPHDALAHCDGLVLVGTREGKVHLFNPAARQDVTLPWSPGGDAPLNYPRHQAFGLGRDTRSGAYKAGRYFHRLVLVVATGWRELTTGMEVFTIGTDRRWRELGTQPPHHVIPGRTATSFKGSLVWTVDGQNENATAPGFLRLSLEDETFGVTPGPPCHDPRLGYALSELRGELCLVRMVEPNVLEMWMSEDAVRPRWERRYSIRDAVQSRRLPRPVATLEEGIVFHDEGWSHCDGYVGFYSFQTRAYKEMVKMHTGSAGITTTKEEGLAQALQQRPSSS